MTNNIIYIPPIPAIFIAIMKNIYMTKAVSTAGNACVSNTNCRKYLHLIRLLRHKRKKAAQAKEKLLTLLSNKAVQNELTDGKDHIRSIPDNRFKDTDVISMFDSSLSRAIGIEQDTLTDAFIVVQIYYFDIFKDISFYGFTYKGEKYQYFTSSAGQIRQKKAVFMKESIWKRVEKNVMCGLILWTKRIIRLRGKTVMCPFPILTGRA